MTLYFDITEAQIAECKEFDANIWSDLHKDAYGYRPRFSLAGYTASQLDNLWQETLSDLADEIERQDKADIASEIAFDQTIAALIRLGAKDEKMAFRWLAEAEEIDLKSPYGPTYWCYELHLPYRLAPELEALAEPRRTPGRIKRPENHRRPRKPRCTDAEVE